MTHSPLIPATAKQRRVAAKAGTQAFCLRNLPIHLARENGITKNTKNTNGSGVSAARRSAPFVLFVFFVVEKAWVPAFAVMSGKRAGLSAIPAAVPARSAPGSGRPLERQRPALTSLDIPGPAGQAA